MDAKRTCWPHYALNWTFVSSSYYSELQISPTIIAHYITTIYITNSIRSCDRVTWPETSYNYSMLHITKMDFSTKIMSWSLATTAAPALVLCYLLKEKQILRKNATQSYFVTTVNFLIIVQIWMLNELKCCLLIF